MMGDAISSPQPNDNLQDSETTQNHTAHSLKNGQPSAPILASLSQYNPHIKEAWPRMR
jgi:hypothetical protein